MYVNEMLCMKLYEIHKNEMLRMLNVMHVNRTDNKMLCMTDLAGQPCLNYISDECQAIIRSKWYLRRGIFLVCFRCFREC